MRRQAPAPPPAVTVLSTFHFARFGSGAAETGAPQTPAAAASAGVPVGPASEVLRSVAAFGLDTRLGLLPLEPRLTDGGELVFRLDLPALALFLGALPGLAGDARLRRGGRHLRPEFWQEHLRPHQRGIAEGCILIAGDAVLQVARQVAFEHEEDAWKPVLLASRAWKRWEAERPAVGALESSDGTSLEAPLALALRLLGRARLPGTHVAAGWRPTCIPARTRLGSLHDALHGELLQLTERQGLALPWPAIRLPCGGDDPFSVLDWRRRRRLQVGEFVFETAADFLLGQEGVPSPRTTAQRVETWMQHDPEAASAARQAWGRPFSVGLLPARDRAADRAVAGALERYCAGFAPGAQSLG
jgi:hypothetical protein